MTGARSAPRVPLTRARNAASPSGRPSRAGRPSSPDAERHRVCVCGRASFQPRRRSQLQVPDGSPRRPAALPAQHRLTAPSAGPTRAPRCALPRARTPAAPPPAAAVAMGTGKPGRGAARGQRPGLRAPSPAGGPASGRQRAGRQQARTGARGPGRPRAVGPAPFERAPARAQPTGAALGADVTGGGRGAGGAARLGAARRGSGR